MGEYSNWKCGRYLVLEWCTQLPSSFNRPLVSPVFLFRDSECCLHFTMMNRDSTKFGLYWIVDRDIEICPPFFADLEVGFRKENISSYDAGSVLVETSLHHPFWIFEPRDHRSQLPADFPTGDKFMKFRIRVKNEDAFPDEDKNATGKKVKSDPCLECLSDDFLKLFEAGTFQDVEVMCGGHVIKAHKNVLATRSDVFAAMLQSDMVEGRTGVVVLKDMDMDEASFQEFVRYLYTGKLDNLIFEKAKKLYEAGDEYNISCLMHQCSCFLSENLTRENALECLALADAHSDQCFKDSVLCFILDKRIYLDAELWPPFSEAFPKLVAEVLNMSDGWACEQ